MRKPRLLILLCLLVAISQFASAQTSWKGTNSTAWRDVANWTNGIPTASVDAIIGDVNFTGTNQPTVGSSGSCKSLTLGGTKTVTFTVNKNLTITGNILINSNATFTLGKATITVNGNWTNNGTFSATSTNANSGVIFGGTSQTLGGTSTTSFRKLTINAGSILTLNNNVTVVSGGSMIINGTINPYESPTYTVTTPNISVGATGTIKVNAATFTGNYNASSITLSAGSTVDYSSTTTNQTVSSALTYSTLRISGTTTKSLTSNLNDLKSTSSTEGNILVAGGTLDLSSYTANRGASVAGGALKISNGATLKIGGTGTLPSNYATNTFSLTSNVEYYGTTQAVSAQSYGNLLLSSSSGTVTKTMPTSAFTIQGNLTSSAGSGIGISFTAASNITVNGNFTIGASTTFNSGNSFTHLFAGNLVNNGTLSDNASTINMTGPGTSISGSGTFNFNNLGIAASNITAAANIALNVGGNFSTSGEGIFTHLTGGSLNMKGTSKSISGANITLNDVTIDGSITTNSNLLINGNFAVNSSKSFTATSGTIIMKGGSKTISGNGSISFSELSIPGSITTASNFSISSALDISGSFTASGGTATFTGSSALNGTVNLYDVTLNGTSLKLSTNAQLGIAHNFTLTSGSLNVTTSIPNTVTFNGTGAQTIPACTFHHLVLATGETKTAGGTIVTNGNFTINSLTTFDGSSYTHSLFGDFVNNGSFTKSTSTIQFSGAQDASITGATTFHILTINKTSSSSLVSLLNDVNAATVNMTNGMINTGSQTLTITVTRNGSGIIQGTIKREHPFITGVDYAFESPYNKISFNTVSGVTSITQTVKFGVIKDYPYVSAINREYTLSVPSGTYDANLYLHYEDAELGGNEEAIMQLWKNNGSGWSATGKTGNDATSNFVYLNAISNLNQRWTLASLNNVLQWNGSVSTDWNTPGNWTVIQGVPGSLPVANDVIQIGNSIFTNQPTITSNVTVKNIEFGSEKAATLSIGTGGSLITGGNIRGSWNANAVHTINAGAQNLTINGDLVLSDGTTNHAININASSGSIVVGQSLTQSGGANIVYSGTGSLSIAGNYYYSSGTFTASNCTVTYNGTQSQVVAGIPYYHLNINKASGTATISNAATINGNCTVSSGTLAVSGATSIAGNLNINSGATLSTGNTTLSVMGNWNNSGTFIPGSSTVTLNGNGNQTISATTFNKLSIAKTSGTASLTGNISINGDVSVTASTLDLAIYTANRTSLGGVFEATAGSMILVSGVNNWPSNYSTYTLASTSTVYYNGTGAQTVGGITYGNLILSNGASNAKTLGAMITVAGDLTISSGATLDASSYNIALGGNWTNSGTFNASSSTVLLNGSTKTITGNTNFNRVVVYGSYTVSGSNIIYDKLLNVTTSGSFEAGSGTAVLNGDLINSGRLTSSGTTTFSGTTTQTIRLLNALVSTSSGVVNFNGTVSPVLNSTSMPTFANLNINNSGGVAPSVGWLVLGNLAIGTGASFHGGISTHTISGNFTNNGIVTSSGTLYFNPSSVATIALGSNFNSSGKVIFGGTAPLTITGAPQILTDVVIGNTNAVNPSSNWSVSRSFTVNNDAVFNAGSNTYAIAGDFESNGTLEGGSSTFILSSTAPGNLTASSQTIFNHLTISGNIIANTDVNVSRNFSNNGTFDATIAALNMTGSANSIIGSTTSPLSLDQIINTKEASATTTMAVNISNVTDFEVRSGTFDTKTYTITQDVDGGTLKIYDQATLKVGGTNSLPVFTTYFISALSTVEYAGTTQSITATPTYGHLVISGGTATPSGALTIANNFTLSNGTFAAGTFTHKVGGDWKMTGGTYNNAGSTIQFNGTSDQQISSTGAFNLVSINKTAGLASLTTPVTINGGLSFTSGKLSINDNDLIMGTAATISGASSSQYIIAIGKGSLAQNVAAGGSKVFPVGKANAYLPATISLQAGSTLDSFRVRIMDVLYTSGTTGSVMTANAVNATWMISEKEAGGSNATISLQWPADLELPGFNRSTSRLAHFASNTWEYGSSDIAASGTNPYTLTRTGITSFSPFGVMAYSSAAVLPVTWLSVSGKNEGTNNHIYWSTASEYNNKHFVVEASADGQRFAEVGKVLAKGNSTTVQAYDFVHKNVTSTVTRYRIVQVDLDGKYTYSQVIQVVGSSGFHVLLPSGNIITKVFAVNVQVPQNTGCKVMISDAGGKVLIQREQPLYKGGNLLNLELPMSAAGVYFFQLQTSDGRHEVMRFVKQ